MRKIRGATSSTHLADTCGLFAFPSSRSPTTPLQPPTPLTSSHPDIMIVSYAILGATWLDA